MITIYCPYCEEDREEIEFHYSGEAFIIRPDTTKTEISDEQWGDYVFTRENTKGEQTEQWIHNAACRKFFIVKRNTATHQIIETRVFPTNDKK